MKILSNLKRTLVVAGVLVPTVAYAHWDRPSCYIDVHSSCYANKNSPCSAEEYKDYLRMCDDTYPIIGGTIGSKKLKTTR